MSFTWLEWKGLTPMALGLEPHEIDPAWHDAMLMIRAGYSEEKKRQWDS